MRLSLRALVVLTAVAVGQYPSSATAQAQIRTHLAGLERPVEILKDRWGISHIYAETEHDLFFAQGYNAARDRQFQLELWRRQATGTVAEILGPRELKRDIGTRLFKFRKDLTQELTHYHPHGVAIVQAFVDGINAYVDEANRHPEQLPLEFKLLGIRPQHWAPEVVVSRFNGLLGNITDELATGRAVAALGPDEVKFLEGFGPGDPDLTFDPAIDPTLLSADILELYNAFREPVRFRPEDVAAPYRRAGGGDAAGAAALLNEAAAATSPTRSAMAGAAVRWGDRSAQAGSNNWVVSGARTESRYPMMANDPHRRQAAPSLRYWVHLVGPGWDVMGGGEPALPGVSIGHNEDGAWGLTVFETDGEDLYVYDTNPANPNEYKYEGQWEPMTVIREQIPVKGQAAYTAEFKYTRHGPVVFEDKAHHKAYAVRAAWMEIGGSPYLASLRMDQARSWDEFRDACSYSNIPGENMVWADRSGTIGWQAVGIAPIRPNFSGLIPVPGDGRYEWAGFLPIKAKPHVVNPPRGYFATANNDLIPRDYPYMDAVGFSWSDPYRWDRINEVLGGGRKMSVADMERLQTDELAIPARQIVPLLKDLSASDDQTEAARRRLLAWNDVLDKRSPEAAIYVTWENTLRKMLFQLMVPPAGRDVIDYIPLSNIVRWLVSPPGEFGSDPLGVRDSLLLAGLETAVSQLSQRLGPDMSTWQYGAIHHALLFHPLSPAVNDTTRAKLDVGPLPRGGYGVTVNATDDTENQRYGASFRIIVDTRDWDRTVGSNVPGQSGDPDDAHYRDLFTMWANNRYFPAYFSRGRVEAVTEQRLELEPGR
jgi:penicillin amidase